MVTLNKTSDGKSIASAEYKRFEISAVTFCDFHLLESKWLQNCKKSYSKIGLRKQDVIYLVAVRKLQRKQVET
jgi:hypothetical protein